MAKKGREGSSSHIRQHWSSWRVKWSKKPIKSKDNQSTRLQKTSKLDALYQTLDSEREARIVTNTILPSSKPNQVRTLLYTQNVTKAWTVLSENSQTRMNNPMRKGFWKILHDRRLELSLFQAKEVVEQSVRFILILQDSKQAPTISTSASSFTDFHLLLSLHIEPTFIGLLAPHTTQPLSSWHTWR